MNPRAVFAAVVLVVAGVAAAAWIGQQQSDEDKKITSLQDIRPEDQGLPEDTVAPFPEAVADVIQHDFGVMEVGEKGTHVFTIRNVGEDVLRLKAGPSTCKCTVGGLEDSEVAPGGSAPVTLTWELKSSEPLFSQQATIWTNDKKRRIDFTITGRAQERIYLLPNETLNAGNVIEGSGAKTEVSVCSEILSSFPEPEVSYDAPLLSHTVTPLTPAELADRSAKTGYKISFAIDPKVPVGDFLAGVQLRIPQDDRPIEKSLTISARRMGPIAFLPRRDSTFYTQALLADFGFFKATEGKVFEVTILFDRIEEGKDIEITGIDCDFPVLKVTAVIDEGVSEQLPGKTAYRIRMEYPAGSPPIDKSRATAPRIFLKTSHPEIPEIILRAEIHAT